MSFYHHLEELDQQYFTWLHIKGGGNGLDDVTEILQEKYPGPYRVIEKYSPIKGRFVLKLHFDDPKDETIWLLRNA